MRRFNGKILAVAFGVLLFAHAARAAPITGGIGFAGSIAPVPNWATVNAIDVTGNMAVVLCTPISPCSGSFAVFNSPNMQTATYNDLVNFTGPIAPLWVFDGFMFNLATITSITRAANGIVLQGNGTLFGPAGFDPTGASWSFSADETNTVFRFSSTTSSNATPSVPDGGATATLLGLAFAGVAALRRRWTRIG